VTRTFISYSGTLSRTTSIAVSQSSSPMTAVAPANETRGSDASSMMVMVVESGEPSSAPTGAAR
jgi:hypothetical protein